MSDWEPRKGARSDARLDLRGNVRKSLAQADRAMWGVSQDFARMKGSVQLRHDFDFNRADDLVGELREVLEVLMIRARVPSAPFDVDDVKGDLAVGGE